MKNALIRLREHYHELAGAERTVAEYILKTPKPQVHFPFKNWHIKVFHLHLQLSECAIVSTLMDIKILNAV